MRKLVEKLTPPSVDRYMVEVGEIEEVLRRIVGVWRLARGEVFVRYLDRNYWVVDEGQLDKLVKWGRVERRWVEDEYDCDDFAWRFKSRASWGLGVNGVAFVSDPCVGHSYNLVFTWNWGRLDVYVYDPTMDVLQRWEDRNKEWYCLLQDSLIIV